MQAGAQRWIQAGYYPTQWEVIKDVAHENHVCITQNDRALSHFRCTLIEENCAGAF